jgi:WD40 repeat protein
VTSLSFNDNGYNFASSSDAGEVVVWDLRKGKMVATINKEGDDDIMEGGMDAVEFDSTGKYLAYASQAGVRVVMMKEWDKVLLNISTTGFKAAKGRAAKPHVALGWSGSLSTCFVLGCTNDRALKFFGSPAAIAAEE